MSKRTSGRSLGKAVAGILSFALAIGGLITLQAINAPSAEAVGFSGTWRPPFSRSQLFRQTGEQNVVVIDDPGSLSSFNGAWQSAITYNQSTNGTAGTAMQTIGVGPVFKHEGNHDIMFFATRTNGNSQVLVPDMTNPAAPRLNAITGYNLPGSFNGNLCRTGAMWGAEINQKNGYVYVSSYAAGTFNGTTTGAQGTLPLGIYKVSSNGNVTPIACSGNTITPKAGRSLNQQWSDAGMPGNATGNWTYASDMAIDANGDFYIFMRNGSNQQALVRINVPLLDNGEPNPSGSWTWSVARFFSGPGTTNTGYGMAFLDGSLYVLIIGGNTWRMDTLAGTSELLSGSSTPEGTGHLDLGAAQLAPVIEGTIFHDLNGNGVRDPGEPGIMNVEVEIYEQLTPGGPAVLKGSVLTDPEGDYAALLPDSGHAFYVRPKQPQVDGMNVYQTYASGGDFSFDENGDGILDPMEVNTVTAYCFENDNGAISRKEHTTSGPCMGARQDRIDPTTLGSGGVFDQNTGAAWVSKVDMHTDLAVVSADFGFASYGSWGDAASPNKSLANDNGPFHANGDLGTITLGEKNGTYNNGVNDPNSNAHDSDDGIFVLLADGVKVPLQDQLFSAGLSYNLQADVTASPEIGGESNVTVTGFFSPMGSTTLPTGAGSGKNFGTVSDGKAVLSSVLATTAPAGGISPAVARFNASNVPATSSDNATGSYAPLKDSAGANTTPWVTPGEIEDYRIYYATAQIRLGMKTNGGTITNQGFSLTNVVSAAPSQTTDSISTTVSGMKVVSSTPHAIAVVGTATTVTPTGTLPAGWAVTDVVCNDSVNGTALTKDTDYTVNMSNGSFTIAPNVMTGNLVDVTCVVELAMVPSPNTSTFTIDKTSTTTGQDIVGTATVKDAAGTAMANQTVYLSTPDSDLKLNNESGDEITTCMTDAAGQCKVYMTSNIVGTYTVNAKVVDASGSQVDITGGNTPPDSPKTVEFTPTTDPYPEFAELDITPAGPIVVGTNYTAKITAKDDFGNLLPGHEFTFTADPAEVQFASNGKCTTNAQGTCEVTFTSEKADTYAIHAKIANTDVGGGGDTAKASPQDRTFFADEIDPDKSSLTVTDYVEVGENADVVITLRDKFDNPISGLTKAQLVLSSDPTGPTFGDFAEDPADSGVYKGTVTTNTAGTYT
ncbi:MAG: Ig-like domain-containing protein, partial [Propionibacteriaceae bacterium]|nr:Ig-like domain-containing protein [Propionibacteriaceae bacterium]